MISSRQALRFGLMAVAALIVLVIGAGVILVATFDPNSQKPRIIAAVKQATGRDLKINGPIGLGLSLHPTIEAKDVALSNPPGFSQADMATLDSLNIRLALLPLVSGRIEIDRLTMVNPEVLLETDSTGNPNWRFTPEQPPAQQTAQPGAPSPSGRSPVIDISDVTVTNGNFAYRDGRTGQTTVLGVKDLALQAGSSGAHAVADASYNGAAFRLVADTGPLVRLQDPASATPWPVALRIEAGAARIVVDGAATQPLQGRGYDVTATGDIPDMAALAPFMPGLALPPLHDVRFKVRLTDNSGTLPVMSEFTLHAGAADLGAQIAGLRLDRLDVAAPAPDQPIKADIALRYGDAPVTATGQLGTPAALLSRGQAATPFPVDVTASAAGATFVAKGTIAQPAVLAGVDLRVNAQVPDLAALGALAKRDLPPVRSVAFETVLKDADGGLSKGMALYGMRLTSSAGDVAGDIGAGFGTPRLVTAILTSSRIDLDALQPAFRPAPASPATPSPGGPPPDAGPGRNNRIFSDQPLPFGQLKMANADIRWAIAALRQGGADYQAITAHLTLHDGKLRLDPFKADLPEGHLEGIAEVDASQAVPSAALRLHAPGIAIQPVLAAMGQPAYVTGKLEVQADLRGAGASPHAIAASLAGPVGLAMANGSVDNRLLGSTLGKVMQQVNVLDLVGKGGTSDLRCLAVRLELQNGIGVFRTLALSSTLATVHGEGSVNLGEETLALRLAPQGRVGGTSFVIPVRVTGPIRTPAVAMDPKGLEDKAGNVATAMLGGAKPLDALGGLLGASKVVPGSGGDACAGPLAIARGQAPPAEAKPEAIASPSTESQPRNKALDNRAPDPGALLRQLFR